MNNGTTSLRRFSIYSWRNREAACPSIIGFGSTRLIPTRTRDCAPVGIWPKAKEPFDQPIAPGGTPLFLELRPKDDFRAYLAVPEEPELPVDVVPDEPEPPLGAVVPEESARAVPRARQKQITNIEPTIRRNCIRCSPFDFKPFAVYSKSRLAHVQTVGQEGPIFVLRHLLTTVLGSLTSSLLFDSQPTDSYRGRSLALSRSIFAAGAKTRVPDEQSLWSAPKTDRSCAVLCRVHRNRSTCVGSCHRVRYTIPQRLRKAGTCFANNFGSVSLQIEIRY